MPPSKGVVWQQYVEKNEDGNFLNITCKHCKTATYTAPNPTRMRQHLIKCKRCPQDVLRAILGPENLGPILENERNDMSVDDPGQGSSVQPQPAQPSDITGPPAKMRRGVISSFIDTMTATESEKIGKLFARAAFVKGYPLSIYEGPEMQAAFQALRPCYKPPSSKRLGGSLLDDEYKMVKKSGDIKIKEAECLTLMCDGWTNKKRDGLINFVVGTPAPVFFKCVEVGKERENAIFVASQLEAMIEEIGSSKVCFLNTDNAAVMRAACKIVQSKFPHICPIGCACHCIDLVFKDFLKLDEFKNLFEKAKTVVRIKNHRRAYATFKEKQRNKYGRDAKKLVLPSQTRFHGAYLTFCSLQQNKCALQVTALIDDLDIPGNLAQIILESRTFWPLINFAVQFLKPLAEGTTLLEADESKLSHVVSIFMNIKYSVTACLENDDCPLSIVEVSSKITDIVKHRIGLSVKPVHLAAYLIDPNFCGRGLSDHEIVLATKTITNIAECLKLEESKVVTNLLEFRTKKYFFANEALWKFKTVDALTWWSGFCQQQSLYPIVVNLLSGVPAAIACERVWSGYKHIDTKKRNRLLNSKTEKLVSVKWNHAVLHNKSPPSKVENRLRIMSTYPSTSLFGSDENLVDDFDHSDDSESDNDGTTGTSACSPSSSDSD